ncbi:MAG TPA: GGDEF domain-containing protein [Gemmatimonadales bacterium]|jgi:diguanylate cyclase (GGDEF)-like protein|nr:GGDEF domain-containing protein [Gemmatimonadales bacterium]
MPSAGSHVDERRSGIDRRSGFDRRGVEETASNLQRVFPHTRMSEQEASERALAIEAHRRELGQRLGRNVGAVVAAVDYMLNVSGELTAPTIVEQEALHQLEHRSVTDPLTGLFNRYHFDATMTREIARCRRYGAPLSLLLVDVDRLKLLNDRWGHHAGDQALNRVSIAIQKSLRGTDIAARLGGDEFAIILPDTDAVAGLIVATRIRRNLVENTSMMVTVSGGLVELPRDATQGSNAQLMLVADHALYAAKKAGGNCVVQREYQSEE